MASKFIQFMLSGIRHEPWIFTRDVVFVCAFLWFSYAWYATKERISENTETAKHNSTVILQRDQSLNRMLDSDEKTLLNQRKILANQELILVNQRKLLGGKL